MFCFILFSFSSSLNQIDSIKNLLNQESYQLAYQSANEAILNEGVRKADDILFLLRGNASVEMQKFAEAISDLSHFLSKRNKNYLIYQNDAYALRALAYLKIGDLKKSQNDADKSDDGPLIFEISKAQNLLRLTKSKNITPEQSYDYYTSLIEICPCCSAFFP